MDASGQVVTSAVPAQVPAGTSSGRWQQLAVGFRWTCGIEAGTFAAFCWGANDAAEASLGDTAGTVSSAVPVPLAGGRRWLQLSLNYQTSCGIAQEANASAGGGGTLWCW